MRNRIILITLIILILFSIYHIYTSFENIEGFQNSNNSVVFDIYPKLNKLGNYNQFNSTVESCLFLNYDDGNYNSIIPSLKSITSKKQDSIDVTYNENLSDINRNKLSKLYVINPNDPISNIEDKRKIISGDYIFIAEGRKNNNDKIEIKYNLTIDKNDFETPYISSKESSDSVETNDNSYIINGKTDGGSDEIYIKPKINDKTKIIVELNQNIDDVKCYMYSTYDNSTVTSYKLIKSEQYINDKLVEGFTNYNPSELISYNDDDETNILYNIYSLLTLDTREGFWRRKKKKKKKKKITYKYFYEYTLNNHYEYDVDFTIVPSINDSFYKLKNEENMEFDKNIIDSYGHDISNEDINEENQNDDNNLFQWIKNKLSKSNNNELYDLLHKETINNSEKEIGNIRNQSYEISTYNEDSGMKTHNIKINYNFDDSTTLSNNLSIIQIQFSSNNDLRSFYDGMRQIYVGQNHIINKSSITYSKSFNDDYDINKQVYLLFIRDDLYSQSDIETWLNEKLGISYYDKNQYLIKGFSYSE